ncbi:hypothetical protein B0H13DRAFT_2032430, partial [Mycena leptocephala]
MGWVRNQRRGGCKNSGGAALRIARRLRAAQGIRLAQWLHVRVAGGKRDGGDCVLELTWWNWWQQSSGVGEKAAAGYVFAFSLFASYAHHALPGLWCGRESRVLERNWAAQGAGGSGQCVGGVWEVRGRCARLFQPQWARAPAPNSTRHPPDASGKVSAASDKYGVRI